ncbi:MAG: hypothetical protein HY923_00765 [Elusimicrobia bacterium]|nr:hypothetical protein [Elusimicrobiota bacterium]
MKKTLVVLSIITMTVPAVAREFNDIGEWRREMREIRVKEPAAVVVEAPAPVDAKGCALMKLEDVVISRGVFSSDFTVESGGSKIGEIEVNRGGYVIKNGSAIAAKTSGATVIDCSGAVIGSVEELAGSDSSSFAVKNAAGQIIASSGEVDGHSMVLKGTGGMVSVQNNHWLIDSYKVSASGIDARLAAVAVVMNNSALYRRAGERRRDRIGDHPGRGDR